MHIPNDDPYDSWSISSFLRWFSRTWHWFIALQCSWESAICSLFSDTMVDVCGKCVLKCSSWIYCLKKEQQGNCVKLNNIKLNVFTEPYTTSVVSFYCNVLQIRCMSAWLRWNLNISLGWHEMDIKLLETKWPAKVDLPNLADNTRYTKGDKTFNATAVTRLNLHKSIWQIYENIWH